MVVAEEPSGVMTITKESRRWSRVVSLKTGGMNWARAAFTTPKPSRSAASTQPLALGNTCWREGGGPRRPKRRGEDNLFLFRRLRPLLLQWKKRLCRLRWLHTILVNSSLLLSKTLTVEVRAAAATARFFFLFGQIKCILLNRYRATFKWFHALTSAVCKLHLKAF